MTLVPELYLDDIYSITPALLSSYGIDAVILDIDNTLVPYEIAEPTEEVRAWLSALVTAGIRPAFVSNNHPPRVELFNKTLGLPAFPDSKKPRRRACRTALEALGADAKKTAIIGDQIFTDVLAGRLSGLALAILVRPIKDKRDLLTRAKRVLEKPILRRYARLQEKRERSEER